MSRPETCHRIKGHRRATSCYDFDFLTHTTETADSRQTENKTVLSIPAPQSNLDYFEYFQLPRPADDSEKSVVVDCLEHDREDRKRKDLGLKFSASLRILTENNDPQELVCESPKSLQSQRRLAKIQVKYGTDLGKIEEDAHEASLANSRNSIVLKHSAQKALARIVRGSGSGKKDFAEIYEVPENKLILEEFDVSREEKENQPSNNRLDQQTTKAIIIQQKPNPLAKVSTLQTLAAKGRQDSKPMPINTPLGVGGFFLPLGYQSSTHTPQTAARQTQAKLHTGSSHSSGFAERRNQFRGLQEASGRGCLTSTLQRLHNERGRRQLSISEKGHGDSRDSKSKTPLRSKSKNDPPLLFESVSPLACARTGSSQSVLGKFRPKKVARRGNSTSSIPKTENLKHKVLKKSPSNAEHYNRTQDQPKPDLHHPANLESMLSSQQSLIRQLTTRVNALELENQLIANHHLMLQKENSLLRTEIESACAVERSYHEQLDGIGRRVSKMLEVR